MPVAAKKQTTETDVTRIKASPVSKSKAKTKKVVTSSTKQSVKKDKTDSKNPLSAILGYFVGSWAELKQVHWPTRRATWSLTVAVILFSGFFVVVVLLLDALFKYIFELILA